ncbi:MAG: hypothetical protein HPY55_13570 [Firmicutes bacterium]|nr:hypothetical protein [Bacillota bacterium]
MDPLNARQQLLAQEARLVRQIESLNEGGLLQGAKDGIQELSLYDNHPADVGSETFERGKDLGLKDNLKIMLQKTREAVRRIDEGTWGFCERCGRLIDSARLEAMPMTTVCLDCRKEQEADPRVSSRPIEEQVIKPPYGYRHGEKRDVVAYDGVDTWEDVARHGSSYSPQDQPGSIDYEYIFLEEEPDDGIVEGVEGVIGEDHDVITDHTRKRRAHERRGMHDTPGPLQ